MRFHAAAEWRSGRAVRIARHCRTYSFVQHRKQNEEGCQENSPARPGTTGKTSGWPSPGVSASRRRTSKLIQSVHVSGTGAHGDCFAESEAAGPVVRGPPRVSNQLRVRWQLLRKSLERNG